MRRGCRSARRARRASSAARRTRPLAHWRALGTGRRSNAPRSGRAQQVALVPNQATRKRHNAGPAQKDDTAQKREQDIGGNALRVGKENIIPKLDQIRQAHALLVHPEQLMQRQHRQLCLLVYLAQMGVFSLEQGNQAVVRGETVPRDGAVKETISTTESWTLVV